MKIDTYKYASGTGIALRVHGDLDAHTFEVLEDSISTQINEGLTKIVVDLTDVPYMSSAGIGVLIGSKTEAEDAGGALVLLAPQPAVKDALQSLGLDALFTIYQDEASAVSDLQLNPAGGGTSPQPPANF